jgi:uncharacterized protein YjcR
MGSVKIKLRPYTVLDLAKMYEVSDKTMKKWIKPFEDEVGEKNGYFYSIAQVQTIFQKLGAPGELSFD